MKKLLSLLMFVVMSLVLMPTTAFASTATTVNNAEELISALENGENVSFSQDIKIDPAELSNAYGTTGINVKNGQTIDGAGYTLDIAGAGGTWDSGINTTGGVIKNLTVTGSFRGIFINHNSSHSEKVVLENVTTVGTVYTISCDQGNNQTLEATNSTFKGWTSYAATLGSASFTKCNFGEGRGYAYLRPYAPSTFTNCTFEKGYQMDARAEVTFVNCYLGDTLITEDNYNVLVTSNTDNAKVANVDPEPPKVEVEELPTVDATKPVDKVEVGTTEAAKEVLDKTTDEMLEAIKNEENIEYVDQEVVDAVKDAINNKKELVISTTVEVEVVSEENLEAKFGKESIEDVEDKAGDDTIVQYLDLNVFMTVVANGEEVAHSKVKQLAEEVTFTIAIPETLKNVEEGVTRVFYVIREHEGELEILPVTVNDDGTISFTTNKFSTYALVYKDTVESKDDTKPDDTKPDDTKTEDTKTENQKTESTKSNASTNSEVPKTGDDSNIVLPLVAIFVALLVMATVVVKRKNA